MTPKQMYSELSKIAGHHCANGQTFMRTRRVTLAHLKIIQSRIISLLEKLNYDRSRRDWHNVYEAERMSPRRLRRAQQALERSLDRANQSREREGDRVSINQLTPVEGGLPPQAGMTSPLLSDDFARTYYSEQLHSVHRRSMEGLRDIVNDPLAVWRISAEEEQETSE